MTGYASVTADGILSLRYGGMDREVAEKFAAERDAAEEVLAAWIEVIPRSPLVAVRETYAQNSQQMDALRVELAKAELTKAERERHGWKITALENGGAKVYNPASRSIHFVRPDEAKGYRCSCFWFRRAGFCKHIAACALAGIIHFPEAPFEPKGAE